MGELMGEILKFELRALAKAAVFAVAVTFLMRATHVDPLLAKGTAPAATECAKVAAK